MSEKPSTEGWTIEFDDVGPDKDDRRRFTLSWPIPPRLEGFKGEQVIITRRGQCFFSAQWRDFLARGVREVKGQVGAGAAKGRRR